MTHMLSVKGHFDGASIVLDEPVALAVGQAVVILVESEATDLSRQTDDALKATRQAFAASGMTDDELAEWLEVETHALRGIPYDSRE